MTPRAARLRCTRGISRTSCRGPGVGAGGAAPQPGSSWTRCPSCPAHKHPCRRGDARVGCPICPAARNLARTTAQTPSVTGKEGRKETGSGPQSRTYFAFFSVSSHKAVFVPKIVKAIGMQKAGFCLKSLRCTEERGRNTMLHPEHQHPLPSPAAAPTTPLPSAGTAGCCDLVLLLVGAGWPWDVHQWWPLLWEFFPLGLLSNCFYFSSAHAKAGALEPFAREP